MKKFFFVFFLFVFFFHQIKARFIVYSNMNPKISTFLQFLQDSLVFRGVVFTLESKHREVQPYACPLIISPPLEYIGNTNLKVFDLVVMGIR